MLTSSDLVLFDKILNSFGESLKTLAIKYELLAGHGDRASTIINDLTKSVSGLALEVQKISSEAGTTHEKISSLSGAVDRCARELDLLKETFTSAGTEHQEALQKTREMASALEHIDEHLDNEATTSAVIKDNLASMQKSVQDMQTAMKPIIALSKIMNKPLTIILAIYIFIVTLIAGLDVVKFIKNKVDVVAATPTTSTTTTLPPSPSVIVTNSMGSH